jgi:hypothetical protein
VLTPLQEQVARIIAGLEEAREFALAGLAVHRIQVNPGFARLIVEGADDRTELDLAADARLFPAERGEPAPTLSGEELAVDKLLALFGRAEARDFVDLMELEPRYGLDRLCRLAAEKDRGFTVSVIADMLARVSRLRRDEFDLDDVRYEQLRRDVERWRERALELARDREIGRGRGRDLGLER